MLRRPITTSTPLSRAEALSLAEVDADALPALMEAAAQRRDRLFGRTLTFSPKVFLPLTNLCSNRCAYCSFRRSPGDAGAHTMAHGEVEHVLQAAAGQGCMEALVCIGDKPERGFGRYRLQLAQRGHRDTVEFVAWTSQRALHHGLLPHTNAGVLERGDMQRLRLSNVSLGLMLESVSDRLCRAGMAHHRAPDKRPALRLKMIREAGELRVPFTTGILLGIGETPRERVLSLLAIRALHRAHGHIQEVIVQNYAPGGCSPAPGCAEPSDLDMARTVSLARLILDDDVSVQAPPNLNPARTVLLLAAGINDFGGISPLTPDYINPDYPWPNVAQLARQCAQRGFSLQPRLPIYPRFMRDGFVAEPLLSLARMAERRLAELDFGAPVAKPSGLLAAGVGP